MNVLRWTFSEKFSWYIDQLEKISPSDIVYHPISKHPEVRFHGKKGCTQYIDGVFHVYLNPAMSVDLAEETACHEIEHWELVKQGFSAISNPEAHNLNKPDYFKLCTDLMSTFSDLLIDRKLIKLGYNQEEFRNCLYEDTLNAVNNIPKNWVNFFPTQYSNALGVCRTALTLNRRQWKDLKKAYIKKTPKEYSLGLKLLDLVHRIGFNTPEKYLLLLKSIVKVLRLEKEIYLYDANTGQRLTEN